MFDDAKDDWHTVCGTGLVLPALLAVVVACNLWSGWVWLPNPPRLSGIIRGAWFGQWEWVYWGILLMKAGTAVGCFGWYALANTRRFGALGRPLAWAGGLIVALGTIGVFMQIIWFW